MIKITSLTVRALFSVTALVITLPVIADSPGSSLYQRAATNEVNSYARVIELQHAGDMNGKLLATWEHWYVDNTTMAINSSNGTAGNFITQESDKEGGTILLIGNLCNGTNTQFFSWRSQNHGKTWDAVGAWEHGGATYSGGSGIWEPFLYLDSQGRLLAVFSNERNRADNGQILAHLISTDGGDAWDKGTFTPDVVSSRSKDRPRMTTMAKMDNGEYFISYEFCTKVNANCTVHGKTSADGINWNKINMGNPIATADSITL
ncbi:hypothetical protein ASPWEDRAFT_171474 [Aspergillus wentii DTO 134E9]|uniref:Sialidase domain-containing protein n=1 Tax=Aspergillus wentii DTO 134E9 TaxID=1073089 RepID=A0A1L9RI71_ASPWE|nr:uncharacterized protein ASPWEDRAFT_171474 [Aspergillus wentii DTO 134E9]KAI9932404.1 hypothetical protein MW887_009917 [Aspergillus wentii]OJJ34630.1 hypothetical protein ASPWEDRAFT_171474 [Aspergillus wentii DTO 134E9]